MAGKQRALLLESHGFWLPGERRKAQSRSRQDIPSLRGWQPPAPRPDSATHGFHALLRSARSKAPLPKNTKGSLRLNPSLKLGCLKASKEKENAH